MKNIKVLLINPDITDKKKIIDYPHNLGYLAKALNQNKVNVKIIDLYNKHSLKQLFDYVIKVKPNFVGLTCTTPTILDVLKLASKIKTLSPFSKIVLGGHHVSYIASKILKQYKQVDYVILYEGEETFNKLVNAYKNTQLITISNINGIAYRNNNEIHVNDKYDKCNINKYCMPLWDKMVNPSSLKKKHKLPIKHGTIITARGCWGKCSFCSSKTTPKIHFKDLCIVENEILYLINEFDIDALYIMDLDFFAYIERAKKFISILEKLKIKFYIITRADKVVKHKNIFDALFSAGCIQIELGIESFSNSQLHRYNKGVDSKTNIEAISILNEYRAKYEFSYYISFIMFDPFVSLDEIVDNFYGFIKTGLNDPTNEKWLFSKMDLLPGTEIKKKAISAKLVCDVSDDAISSYYNFLHTKVALVYSQIYTYQIQLLPMVEKCRIIIGELIGKNKNAMYAIKLHSSNIILKHISFNYFNEIINVKSISNESYSKIHLNYSTKIKGVYKLLKQLKREIN